MSILSLARHLRTDRAGFGAMELGLALPFLVLLSLGMVDASRLIGTKIDFEQAAQRTTDFALARRDVLASNGAALKAEAAEAAGVSQEDVTVQIFLECDGTKQSDFTSVCPSGQVPARFVNINITSDVDTEFDWSGFARVLGINAFDQAVSVSGDSLVRFQ